MLMHTKFDVRNKIQAGWWMLLQACVACCLCLLMAFPSVSAEERTIHVGQLLGDPSISLSSDGEMRGPDADYLMKIAQYTGWKYVLVPCRSREAAMEALQEGKIDFISVASDQQHPGLLLTSRELLPVDLIGEHRRFAFREENRALYEELEQVDRKLQQSDPGFYLSIEFRYILGQSVHRLAFTDEELACIEKLKQEGPIGVALLSDAPPFSYEGADGVFRGLLPDYFARLSSATGLTFRFYAARHVGDAPEMLRNGDVRIIARASNGDAQAYRTGLRLTAPYARLMLSRVTLRHPGKKSNVIGVQGAAAWNLIADSDRGIKTYTDMQAAFADLRAGQIDELYCDWPTALYYSDTHRATEYYVSLVPNREYVLSFAVDASRDQRLADILDRFVVYSDLNDMSDFFDHERANRSPWAWIEELSPQVLLGAIAVLFVLSIILAFASWHFRRWRLRVSRSALLQARMQEQQTERNATARMESWHRSFLRYYHRHTEQPVMQIACLLEDALEEPDERQRHDMIQRAWSESQAIIHMIDNLSLYFQLRRKEINLSWSTVDFEEWLENTLQNYPGIAAARGIDLSWDFAHLHVGLVRMDAIKMRCVIDELLKETIRTLSKGTEVRIHGESMPSTEDGRIGVWLYFEDNGPGIPEELMPHLFEPFLADEIQNRENRPGESIIFVLVRELVELQGGSFDVSNRHEGGRKAEFEFFFEKG